MPALRTLYHPSIYDPAPVPSYWEATAPADDPGWTPLEGEASCEVAIIGGGYTGLSAALHLARDHGIEARVLEAGGRIGWGASGRNGGFCCLPATKMSIGGMVRRFGLDEAKRFFAAQVEGIGLTRALATEDAIDCELAGDGLFEVAHRPQALPGLKDYGEALTRHFGIRTSLHSREAFREAGHDSAEQFGALQIHAGFALNPLKFAVTLAQAAAKAGARLHPRSTVMRWLREGGRHLLATDRGLLRAKHVVVAANGFMRERLHARFDARLLPVLSNIVVTRPLTTGELMAQAWRTETPLVNARRMLFYYRKLPDDRILFGARGDLTGRPEDGARMRQWMERRFGEVFPAWRGIETEYFWRGLVCMSRALAPSLGRLPDDPSVSYGFGYHANGVNTAPWAGQRIAAMIAGKETEDDLPAVVRGLPPRVLLPSLRPTYLAAAIAWYRLTDG